jgi:hypothetical protein
MMTFGEQASRQVIDGGGAEQKEALGVCPGTLRIIGIEAD